MTEAAFVWTMSMNTTQGRGHGARLTDDHDHDLTNDHVHEIQQQIVPDSLLELNVVVEWLESATGQRMWLVSFVI